MDNNPKNLSNQDDIKQPGAALLQPWQFTNGIIRPLMLAATPTVARGDQYYTDVNGIFARLPIGANGSLYTPSSGVPSWLAPGTNGQVLTMSGTTPGWATPVPPTPTAVGFTSGCSVYLAGNQSVTNGAFVKILFDTEIYDGLNEFSTVNSKFTVTTTGRYLVTFNPITSGITATQSVLGAIYKNGSIAYSFAQASNNIGAGISAQVTAIMSLAATDTIEFYVLQSDAAARNFSGGITNTNAQIQRLT